jgi:hypothetical protein
MISTRIIKITGAITDLRRVIRMITEIKGTTNIKLYNGAPKYFSFLAFVAFPFRFSMLANPKTVIGEKTC